MFKFPNKAALTAYTLGTTPKEGLHTVEKDESFYNEKIEYLFKDGVLTRITNPKIEFIKRTNINTYADLAGVSSPTNKDMIIILKDENTYGKTTWYTYNVNTWVLMGEYLGKEIKKVVSGRDTRGAVIAADVDYTIPLEYTFGKQELSIYVEGTKLTSTDFIEVGTDGVLSSKVQFKNAIMVGSEIEYVREVNNNQTIEPTYQIVQQKIQDDTIIRYRNEILSQSGYTYGGRVQDCVTRDFSKAYWCDINKKFYRPVLKNIIPSMSAASSGGCVASASSEHLAPFPAWYAFTQDFELFWHNVDDGSAISVSNTEWLKIDFGEPKSITHMSITGRPFYDNQLPAKYKIQGSLDNSAWEDLLTVDELDKWSDNKLRKFTKSGDYRYVRIFIYGVTKVNEKSVAITRFKLFNIPDSSWSVADNDWCEVKLDGTLAMLGFVDTSNTQKGMELCIISEAFNIDTVYKTASGRYRIKFKHPLPKIPFNVMTDSRQEYDPNECAYNCRVDRKVVPNDEYIDINHGYYTTAQAYTNLKQGFVIVK